MDGLAVIGVGFGSGIQSAAEANRVAEQALVDGRAAAAAGSEADRLARLGGKDAISAQRDARAGDQALLAAARAGDASALAELAELRAAQEAVLGVEGFDDETDVFGEIGDIREPDSPNRQPAFADLVDNPQFVNDALEQTQGPNRQLDAFDRLQQVQRANDAFERFFFVNAASPIR